MKIATHFSVLGAVAIVGSLTGVFAQGPIKAPESSVMPTTTEGFVQKVTDTGATEVELGKVALALSSNGDVKAFAERMVTEHTKTGEELATLAKRKDIATKSAPVDPKDVAAPFTGLKGAAFDRAYMDTQIGNHEQAVALFEYQVKHGTDTDLKAWAATTLPTLQDHLKMAREVRANLDATAD